MKASKPLMIKELPHEERPREKMLAKGVLALSNAELVAILLRTGTKNDSVLRVAEKLLKQYEELGIAGLASIGPHELTKMPGIGPVKAVTLVAAIELGKRLSGLAATVKPIIRAPQDVADLLMVRLRYEPLSLSK